MFVVPTSHLASRRSRLISFALTSTLTSTLTSGITVALCLISGMGCEGGEAITPVLTRPYGDMNGGAGEPIAGEPIAGGPIAGEPIAGEPIAGGPIAGGPIAGEPIAGEPIAGEPIAGEPEVDCGLYALEARAEFARAPLTLLASTCVDAGCHDINRFNGFKLSFNEPETPSEFSPAQIDEALSALEPYLVAGQSAESPITTRIIDNHARQLNLDEQSPEYLGVVTWIDGLTPCD